MMINAPAAVGVLHIAKWMLRILETLSAFNAENVWMFAQLRRYLSGIRTANAA